MITHAGLYDLTSKKENAIILKKEEVMFKWLSKKFRANHVPFEVTSQKWDRLTAWEHDKINSGLCPDCDSKEWYEGPSGCGATNWECASCHAKFNIGFVTERISDRVKDVPEKATVIYRNEPVEVVSAEVVNGKIEVTRSIEYHKSAGLGIN